MLKKKRNFSIIAITLYFITFLLGVSCLIYNLLASNNEKQLLFIINSLLIIIIIIGYGLISFNNSDKGRQFFSCLNSLFLIVFLTFNLLINMNIIKLPEPKVVLDFNTKNISEALQWAKENNIEVEQTYEFSDNIKEFHIINQNIIPNTPLKDITKINFTISSGPNYDKQIIIPKMVGWKIDDVLTIIDDNFLNNVEINYEINEEIERDNVLSQSINGQMRRNDKIIFVVSLGKKEDLQPIEIIDLKNKTLFESTLWLKRHGFSYKLQYEFNKERKRNYVISQSILIGEIIDPNKDTITLIISKGQEIKVPNLKTMQVEEITKWIIDNNLKVKYSDEYHEEIPLGNLISSSHKENDIIEEETEITLIISKGQLKMPKLNSLNEFRTWASKHNINFEEHFEYNDLKKGEIIKFSHKENDIIFSTDKVIVYISNGSPIKIPNFIGKPKNDIRSECQKLNLNCTFSYEKYSNSDKDIALSQNKKSGSEVIAGTYVNIGLSLGKSQAFTVEINEGLLSLGSADGTINSLKSWFNKQYPNVNFKFITKQSNTYNNSGFIHENSPIKDGSKVSQGQTYEVWITQ